MESFLYEFKNDVKNWWVLMLVGIVYVIAAITVMCLPLSAYIMISMIFSFSVLAGGVFEIVFAISNYKNIQSWSWYLIVGIIDFIIGIMLCISPSLSMEILPFLLAMWFIFKGFTLMGYSLDLKTIKNNNWGWSFLFSLLIILSAILILFNPLSGALYITYMLSFILLIIGMSKIVLSLDLRNIYNKYKKLQK